MFSFVHIPLSQVGSESSGPFKKTELHSESGESSNTKEACKEGAEEGSIQATALSSVYKSSVPSSSSTEVKGESWEPILSDFVEGGACRNPEKITSEASVEDCTAPVQGLEKGEQGESLGRESFRTDLEDFKEEEEGESEKNMEGMENNLPFHLGEQETLSFKEEPRKKHKKYALYIDPTASRKFISRRRYSFHFFCMHRYAASKKKKKFLDVDYGESMRRHRYKLQRVHPKSE